MIVSEQPKPRKLRPGKGFIRGIIVGIILSAILFTGLYYGTEGRFLTGTVVDLAGVNDDNFNAEVLKADRPVLVVVTGAGDAVDAQNLNVAKDFAAAYGNYCKVVTVSATSAAATLQKYNANFSPQLALFEDGSLIGQKTAASSVGDLQAWAYSNSKEWKDHSTSGTTSRSPMVYSMFGGIANRYDSKDFYDWDIFGEYRIFPFDADTEDRSNPHYVACEGQIKNDWHYSALSVFFECTYQNQQIYVMLPDLTGNAPAQGINYYICVARSSCTLWPSEPSTPATNVGGINYYGHEVSVFSDFYLGEIRLMSNVDEKKYESYMAPCDGRILKISDYETLYSLLGTVYGGDGKTTFGVPNLSGKSPLSGAKYYIMLQGLYYPAT